MTPDDDSPLLTVQEVGDILKLKPWATYTLVASGALGQPVKLGGRSVRVLRADLDAFIAGRGSAARPDPDGRCAQRNLARVALNRARRARRRRRRRRRRSAVCGFGA